MQFQDFFSNVLIEDRPLKQEYLDIYERISSPLGGLSHDVMLHLASCDFVDRYDVGSVASDLMDDPSDFDVDLAKLSGQHFSAKYLAIMLLGESIRRCDKDVFHTLANRIDDEMFAFRVEHQAHGHGLSLLDFASSVLSDSASAQPEAAGLERRRSEIFRFIADYCAKRFGIADVSSGISG